MRAHLTHLPESTKKLIALIGLPVTLRLVDVYGGHTINLYNSESSLERMAETVGRDCAQKLLSHYGNDPFSVALCAKALTALRDADIRAEFDRLTTQQDLSGRAAVTHITRKFAPITDRTIWRILKKSDVAPEPVDTRQMCLI